MTYRVRFYLETQDGRRSRVWFDSADVARQVSAFIATTVATHVVAVFPGGWSEGVRFDPPHRTIRRDLSGASRGEFRRRVLDRFDVAGAP